jgi:hypothetical protein
MRLGSSAIFLSTFLFLLAAGDAQAYLDPGTGSILLQGLVAALAGGFFFVKAKWKSLKRFFGNPPSADRRKGDEG